MMQTGNKPTINGVIFCAHQSVSPELHADIEVVKEVPSKRHAILRGENSMDPACRGRKSTRFVMGPLCARIATMPFPAKTDGPRSSATTILTWSCFPTHGCPSSWRLRDQLGQQMHANNKNKLVVLKSDSGRVTTTEGDTLTNPDKRRSFRRDKVKESRVGGGG